MRNTLCALGALIVVLAGVAVAAPSAPLAPPREIALFNGKNFLGWTPHLSDPNARWQDVWSVDPREGVLICKGNPAGYIRTVRDYKNFILRLEWRFAKQPGNSGVLLRVQSPDKVWPKSVEAQLQSGAAGDFWLIDGTKLDTPEDRVNRDAPTNRRRSKTNEKPIGEWNSYEIVCDGGKITLTVTGEIVNEGTGAEPIPGKIALQSEGTEIHFRNIRLTPLKD
jgi:hypothetical protein